MIGLIFNSLYNRLASLLHGLLSFARHLRQLLIERISRSIPKALVFIFCGKHGSDLLPLVDGFIQERISHIRCCLIKPTNSSRPVALSCLVLLQALIVLLYLFGSLIDNCLFKDVPEVLLVHVVLALEIRVGFEQYIYVLFS